MNQNELFKKSMKRAQSRYWSPSNGTKTTVTKTVMKNPKKTIQQLVSEEMRGEIVAAKAKSKTAARNAKATEAASKSKQIAKSKRKKK